ncbi:hypothetical protein KP806_16970 [Paenibacillus sp. N4]|uniref:hypothetical protein n=1 Tax=Paenibacillus vietnamensis TaxID=2590547 RepID=UPI001CD0CD2F|nr:hypothetical protein [Paenibacillus vietnamensis]MCA0756751.1 hypothetical protein [Paenibacillus vietnamensis]
MFRKWFLPAAALSLLLTAAPVLAAPGDSAAQGAEQQQPADTGESGEHRHHKGHMSREEFETFRLEKLKEIAIYFGIKTEGKDAEQLKKEVDAAKAANKEKWETFKAEHKAKRLEQLRKVAEEHGIKTEGKTPRQLREELRSLHGDKGKRPHRMEDHESSGEDNGAADPKEKQNRV